MRIEPPEFLANLYRDLRDRRLLLPAGALLVALVAVPVLLSESAAPPPPPPQTDGIEATAASPAVLAEQPGIRNYRKRLAALKRKNPFKQQFAFPEPGSADITEPGSGGGEPGSGGLPDEGGEPPSDLPSAASGPRSGGSPQGPRSQGPGVKRLWWTWEVDLVFGPLGEARRYRNVKALDLLPSNTNPLVAFLGAGPNGKRATFLISDEVTSSQGDGACIPNQATCYFVRLKPGEERRLTVAPEGEGPGVTYRLKLRQINEKIIKRD